MKRTSSSLQCKQSKQIQGSFPSFVFHKTFSFETNCKTVYENFLACKFFCWRNSKTNTQLGFFNFKTSPLKSSFWIIIRFTRKSHLEEKNSQYISLKTVVKLDPHCTVKSAFQHQLRTTSKLENTRLVKEGQKNLKGKTIFQYKYINKGISFSFWRANRF